MEQLKAEQMSLMFYQSSYFVAPLWKLSPQYFFQTALLLRVTLNVSHPSTTSPDTACAARFLRQAQITAAYSVAALISGA
jgi:hypothetical protein